jgi:uncharacterized protein
MTSLQPVHSSERIQTIDIIRGIALFGILVINFTVDDGEVSPQEGWKSFGNQFIWWSVRLFMDDRFQTIYCLLFGLGFAIQLQRAAERNASFAFLFLRRMIALFLIGFAMQIFTGIGFGVISWYAMVGILLLLFWKVPVKFLPVLAIFFFIFTWSRSIVSSVKSELRIRPLLQQSTKVDSTILENYVGVFENDQKIRLIFIRKADTLFGEGPGRRFVLTPLSDTHFIRKDIKHVLTFKIDSTGKLNKLEVMLPDGRVMHSNRVNTDLQQALAKQLSNRGGARKKDEKPSYLQFITRNATNTWNNIKGLTLLNFFWYRNVFTIGYLLVVFLLGAYIGRRRILHDVASNKKFLTRMFKWGVIIGFAGIALYIGLDAWSQITGNKWSTNFLLRTIMEPLWSACIILMALGYVAGIALLAEKENWKKRLSFPATVGRLGLTNYILHAVAYVLILNNFVFSLGLYGKIGPLYRLLFAIAAYSLMYFFSRWWLKHFKYGPFEWLWRSLTYLKFQPIRIKEKQTENV